MTLSGQNRLRTQISPSLFKEISEVLTQLAVDASCQSVVLTDTSGTLIYQTGVIAASNLSVLATLAAADYAATAEMARLLGEPVRFRSHYYEGQGMSLYFTGVKPDYLLVSIFGKDTALGMVRIKANKAIDLLEQVFIQHPDEPPVASHAQQETERNLSTQVNSDEFHNELAMRLDLALTMKPTEGK